MMYSLDEIGLIPAKVSTIKHRADVNPFVQSPFGGKVLPIFVAPMTCILDNSNVCTFARHGVEPIMPVTTDRQFPRHLATGATWFGWTAVTLDEFKHYFCACNAQEGNTYHILIDVANGHMEELFNAVEDAKQEYGDNLVVMVGNIANPETYIECCKARVDYVRVGIGGGAGCTTSVQTGIHASMPWLLTEITRLKHLMSMYEESDNAHKKLLGKNMGWAFDKIGSFRTKVIADGGINTIAKAIKCLALGADYVMMGKCFAECEESVGKTSHALFDGSIVPCRLYYGQSSEQGQIDRFGKVKSNPEGTIRHVPVTTNLSEFCGKFEAALRSAMSYCGARTLQDFIGKVRYETMSQSEFSAFIK